MSYLKALENVSKLAGINKQETDLVLLREKVIVYPSSGSDEQFLKTGNTSINTFILNHLDVIFYSQLPNNCSTSTAITRSATLFSSDKLAVP